MLDQLIILAHISKIVAATQPAIIVKVDYLTQLIHDYISCICKKDIHNTTLITNVL